MRKIAIIPARGGSKRIPGKNIKKFAGTPIIAYSIRAAIASGLFDEVMVSTDDTGIAEVARKYGASVPFLRSAKTSDDFATTADVLSEVLGRYESEGMTFDRLCCIYATAPFVTPARLREGDALLDKNFSSAFTCVQYSYPVQRALGISGSGRISMLHPEFARARSQDLRPVYHDAGQFYFADVAEFRRSGTLWGENTAPVVLPETEVQDLDTPVDWQLAEMKFALLGYPSHLNLGQYSFVSYPELTREESLRLLGIRNIPEIRGWMINRQTIDEEDHIRFADNLRFKRDCVYYAVYDQEKQLIGSVNLHTVAEGVAERGIWIAPEMQGKGHAGRILRLLYSEMIGTGRLHRIITRVFEENDPSLSLEQSLGATRTGEQIMEDGRCLVEFHLSPVAGSDKRED